MSLYFTFLLITFLFFKVFWWLIAHLKALNQIGQSNNTTIFVVGE